MKTLLKSMFSSRPRLFQSALTVLRLARLTRAALFGRPGAANALLGLLSARLRTQSAWGTPALLTIEPTNICNHSCLICETGLGILNRPPRSMSLEEFARVLGRFGSQLHTLFFYFMGESFLNREAYRMIRLAADRGIHVHACTNGSHLDPEALVESGIGDIQFQIAGTTPEVHAHYRKGGDLTVVLNNLRSALAHRQRLRAAGNTARLPRIGLGFILFKTNEHQLDDFHRLASELGVDEHQVISPCVRTVEQGRELLPTDRNYWVYSPEAFAQGELAMRRPPNNCCEWLYTTMTVQANGDVVPCCRDPKGKHVLGNLLNQPLHEVWNGQKYRALRKAVGSRQRELDLCRLCEGYPAPEPLGTSAQSGTDTPGRN